MEQTRKCPFCAEEIKMEAKKCKHCGSMLDGENKQPPQYETMIFQKLLKITKIGY